MRDFTQGKERMPTRIDIYIGSDNDSRKICKDYLKKIRDWADSTFPEGYTLFRGKGCYGGVAEDSVLLNVLSDYNHDLRDKLESLKRELKQDAILVVRSDAASEVV